MDFLIIRTSDTFDDHSEIKHKTFTKVEELIEFAKQEKTELVLGEFYNPKTDKYEWGIEIYDYYRE